MVGLFLAILLGTWNAPVLAQPNVIPTIAHARVAPHVRPQAEWGKYALEMAAKRYPSYAIVDYLHVGRTTYTSTYAKETYKFWLVKGKTEFGVFVKVYFDPNTDYVSRVLFCETDK